MRSNIINRWVVLGAFAIAGVLLFLTFLIGYGLTPPKTDTADFQVAELTLIPGPTSTPRIAATPTHDSTIGTATPLPGEIAINGYVQISGTDGDPLRLRASAGLSGEPLFLGFAAEVFQVIEGPQEADGYTWWYLSAPYDDTRAGWAASAFLEAIPSP